MTRAAAPRPSLRPVDLTSRGFGRIEPLTTAMTGTSKSMKRLATTVSLLALTVGLLTACSSGGSSTSRATAPPATGPTYTEAQASAGLLVVGDLPRGYKQDPGYTHDPIPGGCDAVDTVLAKEAALSPRFAVTSYRIADDSSSIDHEIELFATPADAAGHYDRLVAALTKCTSWPLAAGGSTPATISLTPSDPGVLGGRSTLLALLVDAGEAKIGGRALLAVSGNAVVLLSESGSVGSDSDPRVDLRTLGRSLMQRLRGQAG